MHERRVLCVLMRDDDDDDDDDDDVYDSFSETNRTLLYTF